MNRLPWLSTVVKVWLSCASWIMRMRIKTLFRKTTLRWQPWQPRRGLEKTHGTSWKALLVGLEGALRGRIFLAPAPRHSPHWPRSQHCLSPIGQGAEPGVLIGQDFGWAGLLAKSHPLFHQITTCTRQLIDLQFKSQKVSFKLVLGGRMTWKIVLKCKQSTWPAV